MTFEELKAIAKQDMKLDDDNLGIHSLRIPELQYKYLNFHSNFNLLLKKSESDYKILYRKKWEFYSGKDETPFPLKILKQDISIYLESDVELIESKNKFEYYKTILTFLEGILKSLNNRGFHISNAIKWKQNTEGWD